MSIDDVAVGVIKIRVGCENKAQRNRRNKPPHSFTRARKRKKNDAHRRDDARSARDRRVENDMDHHCVVVERGDVSRRRRRAASSFV